MARIQESKDTITYDLSAYPQVQDMEIAIVLAEIEQDDPQFFVASRAHKITGFPCSNCHTKPISELKAENIGKDAHWDISLIHANKLSMDCSTCHNMDKPDELTSLTSNRISFDHSYKQCSQCHSTQYKDWKGGAHGKRLLRWVPPRVSQTCTGCHNPHKPSFEKRWPSRLNTAKLKQESH